MYHNIMVPLDGSKLAECVVPHAMSVARGCQVPQVTLVQVVPPLHLRRGVEYHLPPEERRRLEADSMDVARNYLGLIVKQFEHEKIAVQSEVLLGPVIDQLLGFADKNGVDLIVIATHGRSGPSRWIWGSVTDRILRAACVPVFMVRAPGCVVGI